MWEGSVDQWRGWLRAAGRAESTIGVRAHHVLRFGRWAGGDPWAVGEDALVGWLGRPGWARETRRSIRSSLRGFYRWGYETGRIGSDPSVNLPRVAPGAAAPRPAPELVYRAALAAADPRTRLILRMAGEVGLRRAEIAVIHSGDLVEDLLGWSLLVHGKGSRERVVPLPAYLALELRSYGPGFVFPGADGGHLSPRWVGKLGARVLPAAWTLHTLRHRFATRAYAVDRDLLVVQTLLGHSSPVTTRRYVAVDEGALRRTVLRVAS